VEHHDLVAKGLALFSAGDLAGAATAWLRAQRMVADAQLDAYVLHLRQRAPEIVSAAEERLRGEAEAAVVAASGRRPTSVPPVLPPPAPIVGGPAGAPLADIEPGDYVPQPDSLWGPWGPDSIEVTSDGPALGLVARATTAGLRKPVTRPRERSPSRAARAELAAAEARLRDQFELDDFSGVIESADRILAIDPERAAVVQMRQIAVERLLGMYVSRLGDLQAVPAVRVGPEDLIWLDLDHRAGFILAQIDGVSSYDEIVAIAGMDRLECFRILAKLVQDGVITPSPDPAHR